MYTIREIPSMLKSKIPFDQKYMKDLGKSECSALFIILMECLFQTNNQRKVDLFYQKEIKINSNFCLRYQQFLKKTFTNKGQVTQKDFWIAQKEFDPQNVQSGELLKAIYLEQTSQQPQIANIIEFIYKKFNIQIYVVKSQHLAQGKTQIPKESYAILFQNGEDQYSIIKEFDQKSVQNESTIIERNCLQCHQTTQYYIQDPQNHVHCLECLQRRFANGYTFYPCNLCSYKIDKKQVKELDARYKQQSNQENQIAPEQKLVSSVYQPNRSQEKLCSRCQSLVQEQQFYQNSCNHIICLQCVETQRRYNKCIIDSCFNNVDYERLQQFLKQYKSQIIQNDQRMGQANQPLSSNIFQNRSNQSLIKQEQPSYSMQIQPVVQYDEQHHCCSCRQRQRMENLFTNNCGHYYCERCANQFQYSIFSFQCKIQNCYGQIEVRQWKQYFVDQKLEQQKKKQDNCTQCGIKLTLNQMFQNNCKHNICFDCISNAFSNQSQSWLGRSRCPDQQCRLSINMEQLENFFLQKQQEKLQELDEQEKKKDLYAMEVEGPQEQQNISQSNILDQRKDKYNQNPKIEQIVQQQRNQSQIIGDNRSMVQNGSQLKINEVINCSMCGEDFTEENKPIQMDCRRLNHVIGICCFLIEFDKCLCCEKKSPYETVKFKYIRASNNSNYGNYGNNGNYGYSGIDSQIIQSQIYPQSSINSYPQSSINGRPQIDDYRMNPKLTQSSNIRQGSNINRRPN